MAILPVPSAYAKFLQRISVLFRKAQGSLVELYWETGKGIVEIEQDGETRARYGDRLILSLSEDMKEYGIGFSSRNLWDIRRFYLAHRKVRPGAELTWSQHLPLLRVKSLKNRKRLERKVLKHRLTKREVRELAREAVLKEGKKGLAARPRSPLKQPKDLTLGTCKKGKDQGYIDLGFFISFPASSEQLAALTVTDKPSYTYTAAVEGVIDGDTFRAVINVGAGIRFRHKLRLRGVDTPELGTPGGETARKYVEGLLPPGTPVVIHSEKDDKYGRFLADIFYKDAASLPGDILSEGTWLNQELLDKGLAVRMD